MSLEMTRLCIDVQAISPGIALSRQAFDMARACLDLRAVVPELFAKIAGLSTTEEPGAPPSFDWVEVTAPTPDQMEQYFPLGLGDDLAWHVVCIGREVGLFQSAEEADRQIRGVPNQFRQKKDSRLEALAFYCLRYESQRVHKMVAIPVDPSATPTYVSAATAPTGRTN
ncbi:hypothetical protein B0H11DRAFT_2253100 [Mycena galericulata]|nr:hypothetical protein B0H11DRAFT_2253100 [Mycena galericulata]